MAAPRRPLHAGAVVVAWTSGSVVLATGIGALLAFAWTVGGSPSQTVVHLDNAGMILSGVIGALGCVLAARARRRVSDRASAWGWRLLAAGCLMLAAGQAAWAWLQLAEAVAVPFPSVSDIGFVGQCVSVALGTIVLVTGHRHREVRARLVIEGLVVAAAGQMLVWVLLLRDAG